MNQHQKNIHCTRRLAEIKLLMSYVLRSPDLESMWNPTVKSAVELLVCRFTRRVCHLKIKWLKIGSTILRYLTLLTNKYFIHSSDFRKSAFIRVTRVVNDTSVDRI